MRKAGLGLLMGMKGDRKPVGFVEDPPQEWIAVAVFLGAGAAAEKSAELLSVSVQPPPARESLKVADIVGAGPEPSKKFAPLAPVP